MVIMLRVIVVLVVVAVVAPSGRSERQVRNATPEKCVDRGTWGEGGLGWREQRLTCWCRPPSTGCWPASRKREVAAWPMNT